MKMDFAVQLVLEFCKKQSGGEYRVSKGSALSCAVVSRRSMVDCSGGLLLQKFLFAKVGRMLQLLSKRVIRCLLHSHVDQMDFIAANPTSSCLIL